ncbi:MAG: 7-carboxy-7-deazaguanine synthase QueE [Chloroflexi bacterium]|nr:MAG: 7-carboxy-7-deazaguanine synthase QueE [Chloroflexota bacterium]
MTTVTGVAAGGGLLVTEVFSAIQGEGAHVGCRQVFLRLTGCNIRCSYCDTPESLEARALPARLERTPGHRDFAVEPSPLTQERVVDAVTALYRALPHQAVSVTGGEPLMQWRRLAAVLEALHARGCRVALETNGMYVEGLRALIDWVDEVAMDVKLHSVDTQAVPLSVHRRFLEIARGRDVFVKMVIGTDTDAAELEAAVRMVAETAPAITVYLQPVTPFGAVLATPSPERVLDLQARALRWHRDVRVVPQTHRLIGQM